MKRKTWKKCNKILIEEKHVYLNLENKNKVFQRQFSDFHLYLYEKLDQKLP
jgi:hypothetical protein